MSNPPFKKYMRDEGKAIPMVNYDMSQGRFIISQEACEMIKSLESPIGVISVAGMYRTGKSYLLNRMLLNKSGGFSVGPTINPCTKGLWMWSKTIPAHTPDGKPINALIIDTEGIGATDEDQNHDNKIMTLAILLSSYFLFNSLGTIDENSIQNLSFIVNITKNIQAKNTGSQDFTKYLPTFMWVIRDFSLKLQDPNGNPITSREYLEQSLELQKGSTDFINSKNQIRSLVKEYFKERDCVTLVRPLIEEGNLQNLEKVDSSKLRKEFIDQVAFLRKTVLNSIKPKQLNGRELDGEMFFDLLNSYVEMINKGAVPVIQSAWNMMCQSECTRAIESSTEMFTTKSQAITLKFPMSELELKSLLHMLKQEAIENYNFSALGDTEGKKLAELKAKLKAIKAKIITQNIEKTKEITIKYLTDNFRDIDSKVKYNKYKNVSDYKKDIDTFISTAFISIPNGPGRDAYIYDYIIKQIMSHNAVFSKNSIDSMQKAIMDNKSQINSLTSKMNSSKAEFEKLTRDLEERESKLRKLLEDKESMHSQSKGETNKMSDMLEEKNNEITQLKAKANEIEKDGMKTVNELKLQIQQAERTLRDKDRQVTEASSSVEREKVLMEQKIIFLEKSIKQLTDQQNRMNAFSNNMSASTSLYSSRITNNSTSSVEQSIKEKISKYELEIKKLNKQISSLEDNNAELEAKFIQKDKKIENEKSKTEEMIEDYSKRLNDILEANEELSDRIRNFKTDCVSANSNNISEYELELNELSQQQSDLYKQAQETENELRAQLAKTNKELSLLRQSNENIEKKINDFKDQIQCGKLEFDKYVKILEENNKKLLTQYEDSVKNNSELNDTQSMELARITNENSQKERDVKELNDDLISQLELLKNEYALKIKTLTDTLDQNEKHIIPEFKLKITELEAQVNSLQKELLDNQKSNQDILEEINLEHDDAIQELLAKTREDIEECNNETETTIDEIRKLALLEKDEIKTKIKENAELTKQKMDEIEMENEEKLEQIEKEKNEKIDELQANLDECDRIHQNYANETDQDMALKLQQIDSLNKFITEAKNSLNTIQTQNESSLKAQKSQFETERKHFETKIENVNTEIRQHEIDIETLTKQNSDLETTITEINIKITDIKKSIEEEREEAEIHINELTLQLNKITDELNYNKATYSKELSLKQLEIDFNTTKLEEIKQQLDEIKATFETKLAEAKALIIAEFTLRINALNEEKEELIIKINELKKQYKELEEKYHIEVEVLTKDKEALIEKLNKVTLKKKELAEQLEIERENSQNTINTLKFEFKAKNEILLKENETLNIKMKKLQFDYQELSALYEKDQTVWNEKFIVLEEQRDAAKKELSELKIKYEINLDDLQKRILAERERLQGIYNTSIQQSENAYNERIENLENGFNQKYNEVNEQNKNLIAQNEILRDKIESFKNNGMLDEVERKLKIALENEQKLQMQYSLLEKDKNDKMNELNLKLTSQRESNQSKIAELERKLNEYEERKKYKANEILTRKAVNEVDKENKVNLIQNLKEKLLQLEKINSKLLAENKETMREKEHIRKSSRNSSLSHNSTGTYIPKYKMNMVSTNIKNVNA